MSRELIGRKQVVTLPSADSIKLLELPHVPLQRRRELPNQPRIYFALSKENEVLYIGKTQNIKQRWMQGHDRYPLFEYIGDVRLAWLIVGDAGLLTEIELACIRYFRPRFNNQHITISEPQRPLTGLASVRLIVAERAIAKGVETPFALSKATGLGYAICYRLWNDTQRRVDLGTLASLCDTLECQPGDLFVYVPDKKQGNKQ